VNEQGVVFEKLRGKTYLEGTDVLTKGKERVRQILRQYDGFVVMFSGGKDSWALLLLVEAVFKEDGRKDKITVVFRDEEVINQSIVDFVMWVKATDRFNLIWFAYPMNVGFHLMGTYNTFVAWNPNRKWHRQPPDFAIRSLGVDTSTMDEWKVSEYERGFYNIMGNGCVMLGIRAAESLKRFMAMTSKIKDNWIGGSTPGLSTASPLYDWEEQDIFKWFYDCQETYCSVYDAQMWAGLSLRVSSSLHSQSFDKLENLKNTEPAYWAQLVSVLPQLEAQVRYAKEVDLLAVLRTYPHTFEGLRQYVADHLNEEFTPLALQYIGACESLRKRNEKTHPLGSVPLRGVFMAIANGSYWGGVTSPKTPTFQDYEFENLPPV